MAKINEAMIAVMRGVRAVGKDRRNTQQNYQFRGIDDVANELHGLLAEQGIVIYPRVLKTKRETHQTRAGGLAHYTLIKMEYVFVAEDGSKSEPIIMLGEGMDSGDKSANKAMSAAFKYAMIQAFSIPTADPKDSENDSHETWRPQSRKSAPADETRDKREVSEPAAPPVPWREHSFKSKGQPVRLGELNITQLLTSARAIGDNAQASDWSWFTRERILEEALPDLIAACQESKPLNELLSMLAGAKDVPDDPAECEVFNQALSRLNKLTEPATA